MKQTYKNVDYNWLIKPTGDPFVDAGGYALEEVDRHYQGEKDILELIMLVADIYIDKWNAKLNSFFLDSTITQPALQGR